MPYITLENGKKIKISEESYEALAKASKEEDRELLVPDNIKIENECGDGDGLGIVFNEGKQTLDYTSTRDVWRVLPAYPQDFINCKLVPVGKENLKVGYTYFRTDEKVGSDGFFENLKDIFYYCKYFGNGRYVYVTYDGVVLGSYFSWNYWYQVVPIEDE